MVEDIGELKKRIQDANKYAEYSAYRDLVPTYVCDRIIDEAKKEFPVFKEPFEAEFTENDVIKGTIVRALKLSADQQKWFKKWFGAFNE